MSTNKPSKKKIVVSTNSTAKKTAKKPATARTKKGRASTASQTRELTFGKETFIWMGIGFAFVIVGMALMTGGKMPSTDVWDDDLIYNTRQVVIAPIVILVGLAIEIYAIFKKQLFY